MDLDLTIGIKMNFDAFSHGQITSKLWLCQKLEPYLDTSSKIVILGCWYNVLAFMLKCRKNAYNITGIDVDNNAITVADRITDCWRIEDNSVTNITGNANNIPTDYDVVINCSSEHMESRDWFDNIKEGSLVCIQSSNVTDTDEPWLIKNPSPDIESFSQKYKLSTVYFLDTLPIVYQYSRGYDRYMLIGIK